MNMNWRVLNVGVLPFLGGNRQLYHWTGLKKLSLLPILCLLVSIAINCFRDGDGIRASEGSVGQLSRREGFEDFKIHVDGVVIVDSELPAFDKMKYYELCCSQSMFLHGQLVEGLGSKLVTAMICKTTDIATAVRSLSPQVPPLGDLERWDKTLKSFEDLGLNVGFLRARIGKLVKISRKYQIVEELLTAKSALVEEKRGALEKQVSTMDTLAASIPTLVASIQIVEAEMNAFQDEIENLNTEYLDVAAAPW